MIYYLIGYDYIKIITFISVIFAFALTCLLIVLGKNILPRAACRAYAINGSKSVENHEEPELYLYLHLHYQAFFLSQWTPNLLSILFLFLQRC